MVKSTRKLKQEDALRRSFGDSGDTPPKLPVKLFSTDLKSALNLKALNSNKERKSFINRVVKSVKKTIKTKGLYSKSLNKLNKLTLSPEAGKKKKVSKRTRKLRRRR